MVDKRLTKSSVGERIRERLRVRGIATGASLARELGISRQALHKHLRKMVANGEVLQKGTTRGASYRLRKSGDAPIARSLKRRYKLSGLEEDRVFEECALWLNLHRELAKSAYEIVKYAFSELLNNAI